MFHATGLTGWQRSVAGWQAPDGLPPSAAVTAAQEREILKGQAEHFEKALGGIRDRLQKLEAQPIGK